MRNLYHDLTGDATIAPNNITKELDERLRWMLTLQDPNITVDLRINNGFKGTSFDIFWEEVDSYFNEVIQIKLQLYYTHTNGIFLLMFNLCRIHLL